MNDTQHGEANSSAQGGSPGFDLERKLAQNTRTLVVGPYLTERAAARAGGVRLSPRDAQARIEEAEGLARAIDLDVTGAIVAPLSQIRPASYLGAGKVDEIAARVKEEDVGLVMVDCALSPVQQRNLEKAFGAKVIDRTGPDPRDLRAARAHARGLAAGRTRPSQLPEVAPRALVDPS